MLDRGLEPEFPPEVLEELRTHLASPPIDDGATPRDLRSLLWCSIDNDDSRDLDQLTFAEKDANGSTRHYVAIADVDVFVRKDSAIDLHAWKNTTSVYTAVRVFPMLPEKLSTDLTSLNEGEERVAIVVEMLIDENGELKESAVTRATVLNHAKLVYEEVGAWLEETGPAPAKISANPALAASLRLQDAVAQQLRERRHENGALDLQTIEARPVFVDGKIVDMKATEKDRAKQLIEDSMIAANGVTARFLRDKGFSTIRRVVESPERWDRIAQLARQYGHDLPSSADSIALEGFLRAMRKEDPIRFPDLSLAVVKLMGRGEYALNDVNHESSGHFGLAVKDYTHSTAPNRRYPDLVTQRLLKAAIGGKTSPYTDEELAEIADHCTNQETQADKVERLIRKAAAAKMLSGRIGERFDAIVTGAGVKGTWVRLFHPAIEGKLMHAGDGIDVGDRLRVKLIATDPEHGFIDFVRTGK